MAKSVKKEPLKKGNGVTSKTIKSWEFTKQHKLVCGALLVLFSVALLVSFVSFYIHGQLDQNSVYEFGDRNEAVENWLGKMGAYVSHLVVYQGFGLASFLFVRLFFLSGIYLMVGIAPKKLKGIWFWDLFALVVVSVLFGFFASSIPELGGVVGYELNLFLQDYLGKTGTLLVLLFGIIIYLVFKIKISPEKIQQFFETTKKELKADLKNSGIPTSENVNYNLEEFAVANE